MCGSWVFVCRAIIRGGVAIEPLVWVTLLVNFLLKEGGIHGRINLFNCWTCEHRKSDIADNRFHSREEA